MKKIMIGAVLALLASVSQAVDVFKVAGGANLDQATVWTNSAGATVPSSSDVAVWNNYLANAVQTNSLGASASWQGIRLGSAGGSGGLTITTNNSGLTGGTLTLGSAGIDMSTPSQSLTIKTPVILGASQTWTNNVKNITIDGVISGNSAYSLTKSGSAQVSFNGVNTFSGGLFINAGTAYLAGSSGFGSGTVTLGNTSGNASATIAMNANLANALTVANGSSGALLISAVASRQITGPIVQNNTLVPLVITNPATITISGVISGAGGVALYAGAPNNATNNSIFGATNTYTGATTISSGGLLVSGLLGSGSYAGNITNNGRLIYANAGAQTLSGNISGTGSLNKSNTASTLTLSGANSYSGVTLINAGTLSVGNGSTAGTLGTGNVTNNASLVFNRSNDLTADNAINGTGKLTKLGAGKLTLTAASGYTGNTLVSNGTLAVQGILQSAQTIVSAGATLMGTGTLQQVTLNAGAILAAGNSPGTMTFNGALTLAADSTNRMEITAIAYDILMGTGANTLTLAGVTVFDFNGYAGGVTNGYTLSFNKLFQNWGSTNYTGSTFAAIGLGTGQSLETGSSGFTVIPEPATVGMIGLGALITLLIRRMRA